MTVNAATEAVQSEISNGVIINILAFNYQSNVKLYFNSINKVHMLEQTLDEKVAKNEQKIQNLTLKLERMETLLSDLFKETGITEEELNTFFEDPANFSDSLWEAVQQERTTLDTRLQREIENIRNPLTSKKRQEERYIPNHWLFVR
jgi:uncharacterized protein YceH (UPF0502 family)